MSDEARLLRDALGRFATGVCLITTVTSDRRAMALTANSFTSVSLDPPLVLWNLQNNSDIYGVFADARHYAINVLAGEQLEHSNRYARKGQHQLDPDHYRQGKYGAPVIRDALVSFECDLEASYPGGDHLIIVGRVRHTTSRPTGKPLLFYGGGYCELH